MPRLLLLHDPDRIPIRKRRRQQKEQRQRTHNEHVQAERTYRRRQAQNQPIAGISHAQLQATVRAAIQAELGIQQQQQQSINLPTRRRRQRSSESPDPLAPSSPPTQRQQLAPRPQKRRFTEVLQGLEGTVEAVDIDSIDLTEEIDLTGA
jgi:hypothetical protein